MLIDQPMLQASLAKNQSALKKNIQKKIEASVARRQLRENNLPKPDYPDDLPVVAAKANLLKVIENNQVVIVCGETGSGKTTQLPKLCLELGRGVAGFIGHTQPRRIAARSLAARIAEELDSKVGDVAGYKVRFNDRVSADSYIKVMTDGILLAETQSDADLLAYDTLIIDEAHERSLNIDFILGYLKNLLPKRPDLKVIITSATIDPQRFSRHFNDAPIVEVSGRSYPVTIRYRPIVGDNEDEKDRDRDQALLDAVDELAQHGPGDILVFLPGERDIRNAAELLRKHHPPSTEILPLFGRLSFAQQNKVFQPHTGRRIVLATNVAETSLTVPGIHYVIDTGLARISRYSYRSKVQRLPIEPISRASAEQRAGRCGRIAPGICIRLYSDEDYLKRSDFTDPEILRTNLASVILQMLVLKLGEIEKFPFIDSPDGRVVRDGFRLLHELGAINKQHKLTKQGYQLARLPVDVRLGRMILAAEELQCLSEVLIIVSALATQDPRERPLEQQQAADEKHAAFKHEQSDFISLLNIWRFYQEQNRHLSKNKLRKLCQQNFLSYVRMREWWEIYKQLHGLAREMRFSFSDKEADYARLHQALLTGLLGNIAQLHEQHEYAGIRGLKLYLFPGSSLFKKKPKWIVAAELVETAKRYARTAAKIEPAWIEPLAEHLIKKSYSDAHWEKSRGHAVAYEQVSLYGLILVNHRRINYGRVDAEHARELFIKGALVSGECKSKLGFAAHNAESKTAVLEQEARFRRRDLILDEQELYEYFDQYVPSHIYSMQSLEKWYKQQERTVQQYFYLSKEQLFQNIANLPSEQDYPVSISIREMQFPLSYRFDPELDDDGVTVTIPLAVLNQLHTEDFDYLVPGLLHEKATALIKSLPKAMRRNFVPAPDFAKKCLANITDHKSTLTNALSKQLQRLAAVAVPQDAWRPEALPPHLQMNFNIVNANGRLIDKGRDLKALQDQIGKRAAQSFSSLPTSRYEKDNITIWDFGDLPESITMQHQGLTIKGYPALVETNGHISLRLLDSAKKAGHIHQAGTIALFKKSRAKNIKYLQKNLPNIQILCLHYASIGSCDELKSDLVDRTIATALFDKSQNITRQAEFELNSAWADKQLISVANRLCRQTADILQIHHRVQKSLQTAPSPGWLSSVNDIHSQLQHLVYPGFISSTPSTYLAELPRYLLAIEHRLRKLSENPSHEQQLLLQIQTHWQHCLHILHNKDHPLITDEAFCQFRWLIEEMRVSLFAQTLGTREKVSSKRLQLAWEKLPQ